MIEFPAPFMVKENAPQSQLNIDMRAYSNTQLLKHIIGSESYNVLTTVGQSLNKLGQKNIYDLMKIRGIGPGKALRIMAMIELGKRRQAEPAHEITYVSRSTEIFEYFNPFLSDLHHEEFWLLFLHRNNKVIDSTRIGVGGTSGVIVDPKLVFRVALEYRASSVVLCHNHPSGSLKPSVQDEQITKKLKAAGNALDICVADHLIIGGNLYFSFADEGLM